MREQAAALMLARHAHGVLRVPTALWRGPLPSGSGLNQVLTAIRYGHIPERWFVTHLTGIEKPRLRYRAATAGFLAMARLLRVPVPRPEPLPMDRAGAIASWAEQALKRCGQCCIWERRDAWKTITEHS